jgi:hypothetical protein
MRRNRGELCLRRFFAGVFFVDFFLGEGVELEEVCATTMFVGRKSNPRQVKTRLQIRIRKDFKC